MSKLILGSRPFSGVNVYHLGQLAHLAGTTNENKDIIQSLKSTFAQNLHEELLKRNKELDELIDQLTAKLSDMVSAYSNAVKMHSIYKSMDIQAVELESDQEAWVRDMTMYWLQIARSNDLSMQHRLRVRIEVAKTERKINSKP
jgi:hypothetical protein